MHDLYGKRIESSSIFFLEDEEYFVREQYIYIYTCNGCYVNVLFLSRSHSSEFFFFFSFDKFNFLFAFFFFFFFFFFYLVYVW